MGSIGMITTGDVIQMKMGESDQMKLRMARNPQKRAAILGYIYDYIRKHGKSPSVREIGKANSLSSISTTAGYLNRMTAAGFLKREDCRERKYVVTPDGLEYIKKYSEIK